MTDTARDRLSNAIREFILNLGEERFTNKVLDSELDITTPTERNCRRQTLFTMRQSGIIENVSGLVGVYRIVDGALTKINWRGANGSKILNLRFPFELEKYFIVLPKNVGVVAGEKDSGKTALLLNVAYLNQDNYEVFYFSSEMGELELRRRLDAFKETGLISLEKWKCDFIERNENFADVIRPDAVNLIDFLEVYEDYFKIGGYINQIYRRLNSGVAIIALQKNTGSEWGLGKERGLEKARFYLTLGGGELKIKSAKNWTQKSVNPVGKAIKYKLIQGAKFVRIDRQFEDD